MTGYSKLDYLLMLVQYICLTIILVDEIIRVLTGNPTEIALLLCWTSFTIWQIHRDYRRWKASRPRKG